MLYIYFLTYCYDVFTKIQNIHIHRENMISTITSLWILLLVIYDLIFIPYKYQMAFISGAHSGAKCSYPIRQQQRAILMPIVWQMWLLCTLRTPLRWRHNGRDSVSNRQPHDCLLNRLFRRRSKKTSKLRVTGLCAGNSPGTGEFPAQMASNVENVSIWWRYHANIKRVAILQRYSLFPTVYLVNHTRVSQQVLAFGNRVMYVLDWRFFMLLWWGYFGVYFPSCTATRKIMHFGK